MTVTWACKNALYKDWYHKVILLQKHTQWLLHGLVRMHCMRVGIIRLFSCRHVISHCPDGGRGLWYTKRYYMHASILSGYIADASCTWHVSWACSQCCGLRSKHKQTYKLCQSLGKVNIAKSSSLYKQCFVLFWPPPWQLVWSLLLYVLCALWLAVGKWVFAMACYDLPWENPQHCWCVIPVHIVITDSH